jgi:hypothetical protein
LAGNGVASGNGFREKILNEFFEAAEIVRGKSALEDNLESPAVFPEHGKVAFRSADISCEDQSVRLSRRSIFTSGSDLQFLNGTI